VLYVALPVRALLHATLDKAAGCAGLDAGCGW
jgi:hypothetical protein